MKFFLAFIHASKFVIFKDDNMVTAKKHAGFSVSASLPILLPMGKERSNNRGFTLLELMLVCLLVMVLATLAIPMYNMGVDRAKNSRARSEIRTIEGAVNAYVAMHYLS